MSAVEATKRQQEAERKAAWYAANAERSRARARERYAEKRDEILRKNREYYAASREKVLAQRREYTAVNKDARQRWLNENAEHLKAWRQQYYAANADAKRAYSREHYARTYEATRARRAANAKLRKLAKAKRTPSWISADQRREMAYAYTMAAWLTKLTGVTWQVDHVVPLRGDAVSGLHVPWNLQLLRKCDNQAKGNKHDHG